MSTSSPPDLATRLEGLIARDVGGRGIAPLAAAAAGGLARAGTALADARAVTVLTGFYIPAANPPAAENDGPIGAAFLAVALRARGVPVRVVTDRLCAAVVEAAIGAAGLAEDCPVSAVAVDAVSTGEAMEAVTARHDAAPPSHVVAIERCGPTRTGAPRNLRGEDIAHHTAPLERLFTPPAYRIGIGDGGNELGMGSLPAELIAASVRHGDVVACRVPADALVVAGVSNWGGAALALLVGGAAVTDRVNGAEHDRLLRAVAAAGAVDGIRRRPDLSVDDLDAAVHRELVDALVAEVRR
jgi:hypothetical protein